jgi:hypothetical protein
MRGARQPLKRCDLLRSLVLNNKYSDDHRKPLSVNAAGSPSPSLPTITTFIIMSSPGCTHIPEEHNPSFLSAEDDESDPTTYPPLSCLSSSTQLSLTYRPTLALHLATYNLNGRYMLWKGNSALCKRATTRLVRPIYLLSFFLST